MVTFYCTYKAIHVHLDLRQMFITNDQYSFNLYRFNTIILPVYLYMYVKFQSIALLVSYSIIIINFEIYTIHRKVMTS